MDSVLDLRLWAPGSIYSSGKNFVCSQHPRRSRILTLNWGGPASHTFSMGHAESLLKAHPT